MRCDTRRTLTTGCVSGVQNPVLVAIVNPPQINRTESSNRMSTKLLTGSKRSFDEGMSSDRKRQRKGFSKTEHNEYKISVGLFRNSTGLLEKSPGVNFKSMEHEPSGLAKTKNTASRPKPRPRLVPLHRSHSSKETPRNPVLPMNSSKQAEQKKNQNTGTDSQCEERTLKLSPPCERNPTGGEFSSQDGSFTDIASATSTAHDEPDSAPKFDCSRAPKPSAQSDPDSYIRDIVSSILCFSPKICRALSLPPDFFRPVTEEQLSMYTNEVVEATRENKVDTLRTLHSAGNDLDCCNRFGESLLHMACRRGYTDMVGFLLDEARLSVRIRDDCGRTPLHDACWHQKPQYDIIDTLLRIDPYLLFIGDKRGHSPFAYARREHWSQWNQFLYDRRDVICSGIMKDMCKLEHLFSADDTKPKC